MTVIFKSVLIHPEVETWRIKYFPRGEISHIVDKINTFVSNEQKIKNSQIRQIVSGHKLYKIRINKSDRLLFSINGTDENLSLKIHMIGNHQQGEIAHNSFEKLLEQNDSNFLDWPIEIDRIESEKEISKFNAKRHLYYRWQDIDRDRIAINSTAKLWWQLDSEQEKISQMCGPVILKGSAGSGKTTIALYRLLGWKTNNDSENSSSLYLTYSSKLKESAQELFEALRYDNQNIIFQTVDEFLTQFLEICEPIINFEYFKEIIKSKKNKQSAHFSDDLLWEEFRGIIKGCVYLSFKSQACLTEKQYLDLKSVDLTDQDSLFSIVQRKEVYRIFKLYQKYLEENSLWDDLDLAFYALQALNNHNKKEYSQIIVDEIQDIPSIHLQVILNCLQNPQGLFLTGDSQQAIHPSRFLWSRLNDQIYKFLEDQKRRVPYISQQKNSVQQIKVNYRCSHQVLQLLNQLSYWRYQKFSEEVITFESIYDGKPLAYLNILKPLEIYNIEELAVTIMIIVPNEDILKEVTKDKNGIFRHVKYNVFTIHQSKGLECDFVILYNFFNENSIFDQSFKRGEIYIKKHQHQLKYFTNLFNVACSRARNSLLFIDGDLPPFPPLDAVENKDNIAAEKSLYELINLSSNTEEKISHAKMLEKNKNWQQAAELWKKLNREHAYHRCIGFINYEKGKWMEAGNDFQKAHEFTLAYENFTRVNAYHQMLEALLQHADSSYADPLIDQFFMDSVKVSHLGSDFFNQLIKKLHDSNSVISLPVIFKYRQHKLKLTQKDISIINNDLFKKSDFTLSKWDKSLQQFSDFVEGLSYEY